jgi:hypothetical protein
MPSYKGPQATRSRHASSESGNAWADDNKVAVPAALTTADEVVLLDVPAGTRLHGLKIRAGDLDSGTTLVASLGYRSKHAEPQLAANPTYFLNASASFQAAQAGWVDLAFEPIVFQEPVQIVLTVGTGAAGQAGAQSIWAIGEGQVVGVR